MNFYSNFPEQPYYRTSVEMGAVIAALKEFNVSKELLISCYCIFRQESGNGRSGICNNYIGAQADSGRWKSHLDKYITGWTQKKENMTGKSRLFLTFKDVTGSIAFLIDIIGSRGLYVGGTSSVIVHNHIDTPEEWARTYWKSYVVGSADAVIPKSDLDGLLSMYKQGMRVFS